MNNVIFASLLCGLLSACCSAGGQSQNTVTVATPVPRSHTQERVAAGDPSVEVQSATGTLSSGPYIPVKSVFSHTHEDEFENAQDVAQ
ncbi:hypothetical protein [Vibrio tritonius]|uniref:hypothetical protein n=1 Tax=Vibrio tritonius TaxID=1435069 RepID=UPI00315D486D